MVIQRHLEQKLKSSKKSLLLLGPRQTGKSTLFRGFKADIAIDLSREVEYLNFAQNPAELEQRIDGSQSSRIFIDEIQRLPSLLNTTQSLIDHHPHLQFLLTGSSARKLKRGQANLLPGRIHTYSLGPLCAKELNYDMQLMQAMSTGTLPGIYTEHNQQEREKTLKTYSATYLKEEIQAEALTRNLEGFARFLLVAAACVGEFLDLSKLASEAQINRQSAIRYFEILEETLIVYRINSFAKSNRKRLVKHPKFFFFDNGVLNGLLKNFQVSADRKGALFENLFCSQLFSSAFSQDKDIEISTYRTEHGAEVDFIVELEGQIWAIELKASQNIGKSDLTGLHSFLDSYTGLCNPCVAYLGNQTKRLAGIDIVPWQALLKKMLL